MRLSGSTGRIIFGSILVIGMSLTLPYLAFGAARSFGSARSFRAPMMHRQNTFSHPFNRFGILGVHGLGGEQVIIIQQFQSPTANEAREPAKNETYVPPHWVDGGHGVQVLTPGYWTDR